VQLNKLLIKKNINQYDCLVFKLSKNFYAHIADYDITHKLNKLTIEVLKRIRKDMPYLNWLMQYVY
jgi:hypothetical protein|tara:strand:+ start:25297 stop:25494 length:198 start_codon:yes stop_codon:yes gene_type:complete